MKRIITILLALVMLCGCTAEPLQTAEPPHQAAVPTSPIKPGCSLVEYDPERSIYIDFTNVDRDIYLRHSWSPFVRFRVYSLEPLDPAQISVYLPIETGYELIPVEQIGPSGERDTDGQYLDTNYPNYLYAQYCGVDWNNSEALAAIEWDFRQNTDWVLPEFYVYLVEIKLDTANGYEEAFQQLDLTIGEAVYPVRFGELRLHPQVQTVEEQTCDRYADAMKFLWGEPDEPWGSGLLEAQVCSFTARDDMTVTGLTLLGMERAILDAFVTISSEDNAFEYAWNMNDPIFLSQGDTFHVNLRFREDAARKLNCVTSINSIVEITHPAGTGSMFFETLLERANNDYVMYAVVFDGLDMEPYYRDYYYAQPSWRDEYLTKEQP